MNNIFSKLRQASFRADIWTTGREIGIQTFSWTAAFWCSRPCVILLWKDVFLHSAVMAAVRYCCSNQPLERRRRSTYGKKPIDVRQCLDEFDVHNIATYHGWGKQISLWSTRDLIICPIFLRWVYVAMDISIPSNSCHRKQGEASKDEIQWHASLAP